MTESKKGRGRPKGSGINDHDILLKIAGHCVAEPSLKRTTAIKRCGITNPSVIRRLRDKFAEQETQLLAEAQAAAAATSTPAEPKSKSRGGKVNGSPAAPQTKKGKQGSTKTAAPAATGHATTHEEPIIQVSPAAAANHTTAHTSSEAPKTAKPQQPQLNLEEIVIELITNILGVEAKALADTPVLALIKEQAKLIDMVLPLLASQFANIGQQRKAA